jgi:hypothetical protein
LPNARFISARNRESAERLHLFILLENLCGFWLTITVFPKIALKKAPGGKFCPKLPKTVPECCRFDSGGFGQKRPSFVRFQRQSSRDTGLLTALQFGEQLFDLTSLCRAHVGDVAFGEALSHKSGEGRMAPFPRTDLSRGFSDGYAQRGEAVQDGHPYLDLGDLTVEVPSAQPLAPQFQTVNLCFDAAAAVVIAPSSPDGSTKAL